MSESFVHRPHLEAPAQAQLRPTSADSPIFDFEIVSRGDFVPGRLHRPAAPSKGRKGATPLILLAHGLGESMSDRSVDFASAWLEQGWAVAMIDLPLHGHRSSPKLSQRLVSGVTALTQNKTLDPDTNVLVEEFARQGTSDLLRTREALAALPGIDRHRIGLFGWSVGALLGSYALSASLAQKTAQKTAPNGAKDTSSFRCAALTLLGGGKGRADLDPATYLSVERKKASPLLVLGTQGEKRTPVTASKALFSEAADPKEWFLAKGKRKSGVPLAADGQKKVTDFFSRAFSDSHLSE